MRDNKRRGKNIGIKIVLKTIKDVEKENYCISRQKYIHIFYTALYLTACRLDDSQNGKVTTASYTVTEVSKSSVRTSRNQNEAMIVNTLLTL